MSEENHLVADDCVIKHGKLLYFSSAAACTHIIIMKMIMMYCYPVLHTDFYLVSKMLPGNFLHKNINVK